MVLPNNERVPPQKTVRETLEQLLSFNPVLKRVMMNNLKDSGNDLEAKVDLKSLSVEHPGFEFINVSPKPHKIKHPMLSPTEIQLYMNIRRKYEVTEESEFQLTGELKKERKKSKKRHHHVHWDLRKKFVSENLKKEFAMKEILYKYARHTHDFNNWAKYRAQKRKCQTLYRNAEQLYFDGNLNRMIPQMAENYNGLNCNPFWNFSDDFFDFATSSESTDTASSSDTE